MRLALDYNTQKPLPLSPCLVDALVVSERYFIPAPLLPLLSHPQHSVLPLRPQPYYRPLRYRNCRREFE